MLAAPRFCLGAAGSVKLSLAPAFLTFLAWNDEAFGMAFEVV
jgi:hypothetical protein